MFLIIVYIIGIGVYVTLPVKWQIVFLILNTILPDRIPYIDEIIMYSSTIKKLLYIEKLADWIEQNKKVFVIACSIFAFVLTVWIVRSLS